MSLKYDEYIEEKEEIRDPEVQSILEALEVTEDYNPYKD